MYRASALARQTRRWLLLDPRTSPVPAAMRCLSAAAAGGRHRGRGAGASSSAPPRPRAAAAPPPAAAAAATSAQPNNDDEDEWEIDTDDESSPLDDDTRASLLQDVLSIAEPTLRPVPLASVIAHEYTPLPHGVAWARLPGVDLVLPLPATTSDGSAWSVGVGAGRFLGLPTTAAAAGWVPPGSGMRPVPPVAPSSQQQQGASGGNAGTPTTTTAAAGQRRQPSVAVSGGGPSSPSSAAVPEPLGGIGGCLAPVGLTVTRFLGFGASPALAAAGLTASPHATARFLTAVHMQRAGAPTDVPGGAKSNSGGSSRAAPTAPDALLAAWPDLGPAARALLGGAGKGNDSSSGSDSSSAYERLVKEKLATRRANSGGDGDEEDAGVAAIEVLHTWATELDAPWAGGGDGSSDNSGTASSPPRVHLFGVEYVIRHSDAEVDETALAAAAVRAVGGGEKATPAQVRVVAADLAAAKASGTQFSLLYLIVPPSVGSSAAADRVPHAGDRQKGRQAGQEDDDEEGVDVGATDAAAPAAHAALAAAGRLAPEAFEAASAAVSAAAAAEAAGAAVRSSNNDEGGEESKAPTERRGGRRRESGAASSSLDRASSLSSSPPSSAAAAAAASTLFASGGAVYEIAFRAPAAWWGEVWEGPGAGLPALRRAAAGGSSSSGRTASLPPLADLMPHLAGLAGFPGGAILEHAALVDPKL